MSRSKRVPPRRAELPDLSSSDESFAPSTYFEIRCCNQRVADCASESLYKVVNTSKDVLNAPPGVFSVELSTDEEFPRVSGRLPVSVVTKKVLKTMYNSGDLCNEDWATLYTQTPEKAWTLAGDQQDEDRLAHIAYRV